jgi:lipopolysaccharide transport system permease protein
LLVLGLVTFTMGAGILGAALCARYRDLRHVVPFVVQLGFFVTPVVYSSSLLPADYRPLLQLNPLCGYIEALRAVAFRRDIPWESFLGSFWISVGLWVVATWLFQRVEHTMADTL